jgi:hypothetical protein
VVIRKFISDFVRPVPVLAEESVVWHNRAAWQALPWVVIEDHDGLEILDADYLNDNADLCFCMFF